MYQWDFFFLALKQTPNQQPQMLSIDAVALQVMGFIFGYARNLTEIWWNCSEIFRIRFFLDGNFLHILILKGDCANTY